jgi:AcrR family transcriptional regulator
MVLSSPSRSRRERPAKPALTRAGIIETAVALLRAEGLERVTMRRLAAELDTGAASLYVYVRNTAELHAAVLDEMLVPLALMPNDESESWADRVRGVLWSYTGILIEHPALARSALVTRPSGSHFLALVERLLALLAEGGVAAGRAAWGIDLLLQFATSVALEHGTRNETAGTQDEEEAVAEALRGAAGSGRYPAIAAIGEAVLTGGAAERYGWGVAVLLSGIAMTPIPPVAGMPS